MLSTAFEKYSQEIAYTCIGQDLSYSKLDELSDYFAACLLQMEGLEPGDRVAIQLPNLLQYPVAAIGVFKAGLVVVNINPLYSPAEIKYQLNDSGAKVLVVLANMASNANKVIKETSVESLVVTEVGDLHGSFKRPLLNFYARYVKKGIPIFDFPNYFSFRKVLKSGKEASKKAGKIKPMPGASSSSQTIALLQYTGGTTGVSKGAVLSHKNLLANVKQLKTHLGSDNLAQGSLMVAPLPLYHIYAFLTNILYALNCGHHNLLIPNPRDIKSFIKTLKPLKMKGFIGINTLYEALCAHTDFAKLDFSRLSISSSAGMALSSKIAKNWQAITGNRILEGYGLTESSPLICCNTYHSYRAGTAGVACLETQIKVISSNGELLGSNEAGEIYIKGPQVMQGYWQNEQETAKVLDSDGWLRTGDIGVLDDEGYVRIVDRIKDIIIVSGFNVYPAEIEDCICQHPDIIEAAAIGIKVGEVNEKVKLFVVSRNPKLNVDDIIKHCRKSLAAYKIPKDVEFRDVLPKSNIGKVLRRKLRD